jgi:hypothetical protein
MNLDIETFALVVGVVVVGMWLAAGFARLSAAWTIGDRRARELKLLQQREARRLLHNVQEIQRLNDEIKTVKTEAANVADHRAAREKELAAVVPPPPPPIYVMSEFPAAKRDQPWVIYLRRNATARMRDPDGEEHRHYLLWAADHAAALARGRQILSADRGYDVEAARRYP